MTDPNKDPTYRIIPLVHSGTERLRACGVSEDVIQKWADTFVRSCLNPTVETESPMVPETPSVTKDLPVAKGWYTVGDVLNMHGISEDIQIPSIKRMLSRRVQKDLEARNLQGDVSRSTPKGGSSNVNHYSGTALAILINHVMDWAANLPIKNSPTSEDSPLPDGMFVRAEESPLQGMTLGDPCSNTTNTDALLSSIPEDASPTPTMEDLFPAGDPVDTSKDIPF